MSLAGRRLDRSRFSTDQIDTDQRSTTMLLMHEALARDRMRDRQAEALASRRARQIVAARRWQRRAERAAARARMADSAIR